MTEDETGTAVANNLGQLRLPGERGVVEQHDPGLVGVPLQRRVDVGAHDRDRSRDRLARLHEGEAHIRLQPQRVQIVEIGDPGQP